MYEYEDRSSDPILAMKFRFAGAAVGIGGLVQFLALIVYLAPGFFLSSSGPVAEAVDIRHNRWFGTQYAIVVDGGTYWCSGGDVLAQRRGTRVAYDSRHPEHCRAQAELGRLGIYEMVPALGASSFIAVGLGATVLWNNRRARMMALALVVLFNLGYLAVAIIIHRGSHG